MEHVLRQCLIALRLAERIGLDEEERAVVYYTALLVNVGCHSDAHEQAKWFGDDIALKSDKYDYELGSVRAAAAGMRRLGVRQPAVAPLPGRARVRDLRPPRGGRHDRPPRRDRARAGRAARAARRGARGAGGAYEQWDGEGWPGGLEGDGRPARGAARAARGVHRGRAPRRRRRGGEGVARRRGGKQFDPALAELLCADAEMIFAGLESRRPGTR